MVILTTHLMEEAEALSDRIMILGKGEIKCIGDSLLLKEKVGIKFRVTFELKSQIKDPELLELKKLAIKSKVNLNGNTVVFFVAIGSIK